MPAPNQSPLPEFLRPLFWEYSFKRLSWERDRDTIILRILEHGTLDAIRWLRAQAGDEELRNWILEREGRGLSPRCLRYLELLLHLPHRRVTEWIKRIQALPWENRLTNE
jgi:hypothetical protein